MALYKDTKGVIAPLFDQLRRLTGTSKEMTFEVATGKLKSANAGMTRSNALLSPGYIVMDSMSLSVVIEEEEEI